MTWNPDICIYHFPCDDGFACAWIARKRWPDIQLVPTNYGLPLPDVDFTGKNILIADFSYKPEVLRGIGRWNNVPVAHAPYAFASDLAHELLKKHPDAPFAAVIVDAYGGRTYSLRSEDSRQDVSEVAKMFGGGGHRNAAGFRVPV